MTFPYLDTSALAKWYLNEAFSEEVEGFLGQLPAAQVSSLSCVELRCLLARRRRSRELTPEMEAQAYATFQRDIREDHLRVLPLEDHHAQAAIELMEALPRHSLRTLDALHLAITQGAGIDRLATADRTMANAAEELGLTVTRFFPEESP
ncbi:MAG: type II toxin-antitoxin system VapC family toxin [Acidobacteriota bacterium]